METLERPQRFFDEQFDKLVSQFEPHGLKPADLTDLNNWQKIATLTNDVVTPANALDAAAFATSIYGINNLDSWKGIATACGSFIADFFYGKIARATGTQSSLGEAIDAGGDKIKLAFALYKTWQLDLAPKNLITCVALLNGMNTGLTAVDRVTNKQPVLHASWLGKRAIFMEQWGIGLHIVGSKVKQANPERAGVIKAAGTILGYAGVFMGGLATADYGATLWEARKHAKQQWRNRK
jgi:phosphatidylglycerophosphate synthase